jgi:hypothetical protein
MNQNMETKTLAMTKATTKMRKPRMGKAKKISVTLSLMMKLMMAGKVPVEVVNTIINMVVPKDELRKAVAMMGWQSAKYTIFGWCGLRLGWVDPGGAEIFGMIILGASTLQEIPFWK